MNRLDTHVAMVDRAVGESARAAFLKATPAITANIYVDFLVPSDFAVFGWVCFLLPDIVRISLSGSGIHQLERELAVLRILVLVAEGVQDAIVWTIRLAGVQWSKPLLLAEL